MALPADSPMRLRLFAVPADLQPVAASLPDAVPAGQLVNVDKAGKFSMTARAGVVVFRPAVMGIKSVRRAVQT